MRDVPFAKEIVFHVSQHKNKCKVEKLIRDDKENRVIVIIIMIIDITIYQKVINTSTSL